MKVRTLQCNKQMTGLVVLEVVEQDINCFALLTVVLWQRHKAATQRMQRMQANSDSDAGAANDLAGIAVLVDLAQTSPLSELNLVVHLPQLSASAFTSEDVLTFSR